MAFPNYTIFTGLPHHSQIGYWPVCGWCGFWHTGICPRIKSISYHPNGMIEKVELHGDSNDKRD